MVKGGLGTHSKWKAYSYRFPSRIKVLISRTNVHFSIGKFTLYCLQSESPHSYFMLILAIGKRIMTSIIFLILMMFSLSLSLNLRASL